MCSRGVTSGPGTAAPGAHGGGLTTSCDSDATGALTSIPERQGTPGRKRAWRAHGWEVLTQVGLWEKGPSLKPLA